MNEKLFAVQDRFYIEERGTIIVGEYQLNSPTFNVKDNIILILPDGTEKVMEIAGIDTVQTVSGAKKNAILIENVTKEDIPIGTEIFLKT